MFIKDILRTKGFDVFSVVPHETVRGVLLLFNKRKIGFAIVCDPKGEILGTVSERDICHAVADRGEKVVSMAVREIMTRNLVRCSCHDTLPKIMALMTTGRTRHVLVMEGEALEGIVSIGDLVKNRLDETLREQESIIEYVAGSGYSYHG